MIAMRIRGGLGNQLFQYATGRAVAHRLGVPLALDLRDWAQDRPYAMSLEHFNVSHVEPENLPPGKGDSFVEMLGKVLRARWMTVYREATMGYDPGIERLTDNTLLKGYWQSERYFARAGDVIREDLSFKTPPGEETARLLEEIAPRPAVSLHIRRGDYVSNAKYNAAHGTAGLDYYARAAEAVAERMAQEPVFYAFSDDPAWVRENLQLPFELNFVTHNTGATAHDDLRLMAACRHHIIANSSFSWWGAWLNPRKDKVVVAPKRWYAGEGRDNPDITPAGWLRL